MMKIVTLFFAMCAWLSSLSAVPGSFLFQAVAADGNGVVANTAVSVRVSIRQGKPDAKNLYQELHSVTTDGLGAVSVRVGEGEVLSGDFEAIEWLDKESYIEVEIDKGSGYVSSGISQVSAVPYAKAAAKAGSIILKSASGKTFRVTIDDEGNLLTTPV